MMQTLDKPLRGQLERTVQQARDVAEAAARATLEQLGVGEASPYAHLSEAERDLRRRLRAHGRQLGDLRDRQSETQEMDRLLEEVAYEHWHRMLFARFLAENNLLMYPDPDQPVAVTLAECEDLAAEEGAESGWELAARYAAKMLPQIFKPHSPVFQLTLPPESQHKLERLVAALPEPVFTSSDALGWVYQFWQAKKKEQVNKSEVKIGARELSPVTQLFTEPYMVNFLLDNSVGAWWAGRCERERRGEGVTGRRGEGEKGGIFKTAKNEKELRNAFSLPGLPLEYLRFAQADGEAWQVAAGTFANWPQAFSDFKLLDPCCGSGHFLVAALLMLVPMRMQAEGLSSREAVTQILAQNLYGLELDARCVELAAFALALTGWRLGGGYFELPSLQVACTGLSISSSKEQWMSMLEGQAIGHNQRIVFGQFYELFSKAPTLGSLINPSRYLGKIWLTTDEMSHLQNVLADAVKTQTQTEKLELGVTAQGLAKATELLAGQYTLVATNVPYLGQGKQDEILREYIKEQYPLGKSDLATAFVLRCLEFCASGSGATVLVTPQNWLFLTSYTKLRELLLRNRTWNMVARLGSGAFETISGEVVNVALLNLSAEVPWGETQFAGIDVSAEKSAESKAYKLANEAGEALVLLEQAGQLENPDARISFEKTTDTQLLGAIADYGKGSTTGDKPRFLEYVWEQPRLKPEFVLWLDSPNEKDIWSGRSCVCVTPLDSKLLEEQLGFRLHGQVNWKKLGVAVNKMRQLEPFLYRGEVFDDNIAPITPHKKEAIPALWAFVSSDEYSKAVRKVDQKLNVTAATLVKVPFDFDHWSKVASEQYPNGLPQPYSNDPTQWIFHGHPCGSVIWDEHNKWTAEGGLRIDKTVLQIALARLLGYRWPAELDESMELSTEQRAWVQRCEALLPLADGDGLVCIPSVRGEASAPDRLLALLAAAYAEDWNNETLGQLLKSVDYAGKTLEVWLRDGFFAQHCELFQQRPFIWQIWDGLRDGFSVLVNYHQLDAKRLETLIYTYLGDWITRQKQDLAKGIDGAEEKLNAAEQLKKRLELILQGEAPYDIFVRWKPLSQQPIGWNPDLNDGVRLNIRPFLSVPDIKVKDAGVLRIKPKIKWDKDRGKDPMRAKADYPWAWGWDGSTDFGGGAEFTGERFNDCHYTLDVKKKGRVGDGGSGGK